MDRNNAVRNAMLDGLDATFNSGHLRLYSAAVAGANQAAPGTKIGQGVLAADVFAAAAAGKKSLNAVASAAGLAAAGAGTAVLSFRVTQAADDDTASETQPRLEGTVGVPGANVAITAAALSNGQVQFTAAAHGFANGEIVEITGHAVAYFNRKWRVSQVAANTFNITPPLSTMAPGAGGNVRKSYHMTVDNTSLANGQSVNVSSLDLDIP